VNLIYHQLLNREDGPKAGDAITLMSTDTDSVSNAGEMFHELWAHIIEVIIGLALLSLEVRWLWIVPIILISCDSPLPDLTRRANKMIVCSRVSRFVAQNLKSRQKDWTAATQDRISATFCVLAAIKSVKALGLSDAISFQIQDLRVQELFRASKIRWMNVAYNASGKILFV
jgi:ATP-binding cassette subfamily C (CFTR/MRP) protein 1